MAAIPFCKRPGLINSVSLEGDKIDTIFPVIADTDWECVALLCDNDGIPDSVERRMKIFFGIMEKAKQYGIAPSRLHIDPLVVTLGTDQTALTVFADCCRRIKYEYPEIHITSGLSNISFGLPVRKNINQAFMVLAMNAGMDSAIVDPTNKNMIGMIYATNALLERDEYCLQYIDKFGNKASEEAAQPAPASPLDEKMQKVFKLTQDGKNKEIGQAVQEALDAGCDPTAILNLSLIHIYAYEDMVKYLDESDIKLRTTGVVLFDLDNLKVINDNFGHEKGDEALKLCYQCISQAFQNVKNCFRIGGDEFAYVYHRDVYKRQLMEFCEGQLDENGFLVGRENDWIYIDWADMDKTGALCAEQMLFAACWQTCLLYTSRCV